MHSRSRKALSWSVSIVVHAVLLFLVGRAALNYALPEGEVNTDPTTFDVVGSKGDFKPIEPKKDATTQDAQALATKTHEAAVKAASAKHGVRSKNVTADATADDHVKFMPDKDFNEIKPAPSDDDTKDISKQDAPKEVAHEAPPEAVPQNSVNEDEAVEKSENVPQALPKKEEVAEAEPSPANEKEAAVAPAPPAPAPAPENAASNAGAQQVPAQNLGQEPAIPSDTSGAGTDGSPGGPQGPPAYGPGTTIDITKLIERSGNPKPYYPFGARFRHQEGLVILRAYIEKNGSVTMPTVEKSSGFSSLDQEALKAFARWRYEPNQGGWALKPFQFNIKK